MPSYTANYFITKKSHDILIIIGRLPGQSCQFKETHYRLDQSSNPGLQLCALVRYPDEFGPGENFSYDLQKLDCICAEGTGIFRARILVQRKIFILLRFQKKLFGRMCTTPKKSDCDKFEVLSLAQDA